MTQSYTSTGIGRTGMHRSCHTALALLLAAALAGCGGGGNGSGGNNNQVVVVVSPVAVILVANQTQLFTANVSGAVAGTIATNNGAVRSGNIVTVTTTSAHGLTQGQLVTISGVSNSSFNGTFAVVSVPSPTTFTYAQVGSDASSGSGTVFSNAVKWFVNDIEGGNSTVGTITNAGLYTAPASLVAATTATIAANGAVRASNVVTITTTAAHNILFGQLVFISGVTDTSFNGIFQVASVPSTTTFTYNQVGTNVTSGGGTVTTTAVKIKAASAVDSTATATVVVSLDSGVSVQVTPAAATLGTAESLQFLATVNGSANQSVNWFVNDIAGGNSTVGTINAAGLYTAPATPPGVTSATIASNGAVRNANVVTITTTAAHGFVVGQVVTIAGVTDNSFNGTFAILSVPSTTTFSYSQVGTDATSGGGTATTASQPVTIKAVSAVDISRFGTASAQVVAVTDPTFTSLSPATIAQGSVFEDVYLTGTNFIGTTEVRVNGAVLPSSSLTVVNSTLIRARLDASLLASAGSLSVDIQRQGGTPTAPQTITVTTARPALVAASPDSGTQFGAAFNFNVNGGYYGTNANPAVSAEFNGSVRAASVSTTNVARQASVAIGGADLANAGLFAVGIRSNANPALFAATNLAVQPSAGPLALATIAVGTLPSSVAINTATGTAVVANRGSNDLTLIDLASLTPSAGTIPVGTGPTGVAVDEVRNLAVVANNNGGGAGSLTVVDLTTGTPAPPITANISNGPFAVGVNPLTGLALVAYQNSTHAEIVDLTLVPPAVVSTATVSTGGNPQVAVDPRLDWAVVTPGGSGTMAIVDLSRRVNSAIATTNGATRFNGLSTITTTANHSLQTGQAVFISGVADASFDGVFTIAAVPSSTTFTYVQAGAPNVAGSGGGTVTTTPPVATVALGANTRGIGINSVTQQAILADPTSGGPVLFSLLDQLVTNIPLGEQGATVAAFNPFTDIAVTVNPNLAQASILNPRTAQRLFNAPVGAGARAVAIDPGTNLALVVNETDGTVSPIQLSTAPIRSLHLAQVALPLNRQLAPGITLSSSVDLPLTLLGKGFVAGAVVRLDGVALPAPSSVTDRMLNVTVPAAMLAGPRRYVVDVLDPGGAQSNVVELTVVQAVDMVGAGGAACTAPAPVAVAIDGQRNLVAVTNSGCDSVSLIDLASGTITDTIAVGDNPQGIAISSRLGRAVVTNRNAATASVVDLTATPPAVTATVTTGAEPVGVAISENNGRALVANATAGNLTIFSATDGTGLGTINADSRPFAIAVDPVRDVALVAHAGSNNVAVLSLGTLSITNRVPNVQLPTAVVFEPVSGLFIATSSLGNNLLFINPSPLQTSLMRSGINPTSLGINYRSSTLLTVNTASETLSAVDLIDRRIRAVIRLKASSQFAVEVHPLTNLAAIADDANHRVLLFPLPK